MARKNTKIVDDRPFPFLKLPAELRNRIYDLALTSSKGIVLISSVRKHSRRHLAYRVRSRKLKEEKELLTPNILLVNKQIYYEALPVLYNQRLEFEDPAALFYFLSQIGNDAVLSIRCIKITKVTVGTKGQVTQPAFTALVQATNLEIVSVGYLEYHDHAGGWYRHADIYRRPMEAKLFFEAAHVWIEQLEKNRAGGGKDWREVVVLDEAAKSERFISRPNYEPVTPCTIEEFREDMEKPLKQ